MFRKSIFSLILILFWLSEVYAAPQIALIDGPPLHGASVTIYGNSFGLKTPGAPEIWDDCETGTISNNWDRVIPNGMGDPFDTQYRTTYRNVAQAHSCSNKYAVGRHYDSSIYGASNVMLCKSITHSEYGYASFYYRHDPGWVKGDVLTENCKLLNYNGMDSCLQHGSGGNEMGYYISYQYDTLAGQNPKLRESGNPFKAYYDKIKNVCKNPADGWVKYEILFRNHSSDGYLKVYEDGSLVYQVYGNSHTADVNKIGFGYYYHPHKSPFSWDNQFRYLDDLYYDCTRARVIIGNNSTLGNCTIREVQIPSIWSDNSITITVNQGSFDPCETVYLFVVDADGNVNTAGYPIRIVTGAGEPPCPPIGGKISK